MTSRDHLERIHELPCVVCTCVGTRQETSTVAHHLESVRDENSDYSAVPLCDYHHRQLHKLSRRGFENLTKMTALDLLALTIKALVQPTMEPCLIIGEFSLVRDAPGFVWIRHKRGEGGQFKTADLEQAIREFYEKNF